MILGLKPQSVAPGNSGAAGLMQIAVVSAEIVQTGGPQTAHSMDTDDAHCCQPSELYLDVEIRTVNSSWKVKKRLQSFISFYQQLLKTFQNVTALTLQGTGDDGVLNTVAIRASLQGWLLHIVRHDQIAYSHELREFLLSNELPVSQQSPNAPVQGMNAGAQGLSVHIGSAGPMQVDAAAQQLNTMLRLSDSPHKSNSGSAMQQHPTQPHVHMSAVGGMHNHSTFQQPPNAQIDADMDMDAMNDAVAMEITTLSPPADSGEHKTQGVAGAAKRNGRAPRLDDFMLMKVIGKGSFGRVLMVRKKDDGKIYAMKILAKENVIKRNQVEHTRTERNVLGAVSHPFIVTLRYAFQTTEKLYFVMDFCPGGELFYHLGKAGKFSEGRTRFYAAQIVLALEYLHGRGIIYRDLKPENVLLDTDGYIALTDFGLSKEGITDNVSAKSFCGTPEYLAPEILNHSGHGRAADWWSLGALVYEMLSGIPPFYSRDREKMFRKILTAELRYSRSLTAEARSLLEGLLHKDASQRLGSDDDARSVKAHPWFNGVNWDALYHKKIEAPFKPVVRDLLDTQNFSEDFTQMPVEAGDEAPKATRPHNDAANTMLSLAVPAQDSSKRGSVSGGKFYGFTYVRSLEKPMEHFASSSTAGNHRRNGTGGSGALSPNM